MKAKETPLMKQYNSIKAKYPDALLLFRVGDFYETFGQDAIKTASILNIVLTKRANGSASHVELAGFPHHSLDAYLPKLVRAGCRVAICDQLEDPKFAKGIVKRGVTELVTPGATLNDQVLSGKQNNYLLAIHFQQNFYGVALCDLSTGEFFVSQGDETHVKNILASFNPKEVLIERKFKNQWDYLSDFSVSYLEDWAFQWDHAYDLLVRQFKVHSLKGFGVENLPLGIVAAGAVYSYLINDTQHRQLEHITAIKVLPQEEFVWMDEFTLRNLELLHPIHPDGKSLVDILDETITNMGGRLLRRWIALPLKNLSELKRRNTIVDYFYHHADLREDLREILRGISDVERLLGKLATERITPREMGALRLSLNKMEVFFEKVSSIEHLNEHIAVFKPVEALQELLNQELEDDLPVAVSKGGVIRKGIIEELDELRFIVEHSKEVLEQIKNREIERTGISSLKIDYNQVFGYYIEVRNTHKDKVPEEWIRKQTLVSSERYITPELKSYEEKILGAEERILSIETQRFRELMVETTKYLNEIQYNAKLIAEWDVLLNFATIAEKNDYHPAELTQDKGIYYSEGRHPVIEKMLPAGESYIANSMQLDPENQQIILVTGPNMSGKSALLRQTALIVIMAQIGSFVPALQSKIGLVDKIFTRVGASDNIARGESTFMVEMNEAANIMNNLYGNTLVLLDEIGRGTSTYDGVSIAWAISEYLHDHPMRPLTLFATHYHELNEMEVSMPRVKNFHVSIQEIDGNIHFLRKLVPGGSEHSFGIHVAQLAGMPLSIVRRAEEILAQLESSRGDTSKNKNVKKITEENFQLSFFQLDDPLLESIRNEILSTDINTLSPVEALMKLHHIKNMLLKDG